MRNPYGTSNPINPKPVQPPLPLAKPGDYPSLELEPKPRGTYADVPADSVGHPVNGHHSQNGHSGSLPVQNLQGCVPPEVVPEPFIPFKKTKPTPARKYSPILSPLGEGYIDGLGNSNLGQEALQVTQTTQEAQPQTNQQTQTNGSLHHSYPPRWQAHYEEKASFYIAKLTPSNLLPRETIRWIRNSSDERAAMEGMRFHEKSGQFVVNWIQKHCILYEGEKAGEPLICDDWQYEYFMQLFSWMRYSEEIPILYPKRSPWIRRFTHAGVWIAKKNAKSPTLAATGLYTFVGDGERGQKCYSVARDGKQALIAHTHVMMMVENSPILSRECKVKRTDNSVYHKKTNSFYTLVCGDNYKSTEGYNGSLFVDETHVVDQQHMDRLKRAGISRVEPLHIEMSTAGNNADGYGYNRYLYGQRIAKMERETDYNPHFLFMDFSIDQRLAKEKLRDRDYIKSVAQACNPALGRIIRLEEYLSDWQDSCQSDTELRQFAMYRLNLWLRDSAFWIELADWLKCSNSPLSDLLTQQGYGGFLDSSLTDPFSPEGQLSQPKVQYTLEDLKDYPCVAGLDISQTRDLSALSLIFAVPDDVYNVRPYTWTWHWLPESTADSYIKWIDLRDSQFTAPRGGQVPLHLLKTNYIDHEVIATKLEWIRSNFDLRGLGYDVYNSVPLVRTLLNDYGWDENTIIKVPQKMPVMGPITKEFEGWVLRQRVHYNGDPLLNWQMSHVALEEDKQGNYKPIKPTKDDYRKIDGVISLLIAAVTLTIPELGLWARDNGSILLYERKPPQFPGQASTLDWMSRTRQEQFVSEQNYNENTAHLSDRYRGRSRSR